MLAELQSFLTSHAKPEVVVEAVAPPKPAPWAGEPAAHPHRLKPAEGPVPTLNVVAMESIAKGVAEEAAHIVGGVRGGGGGASCQVVSWPRPCGPAGGMRPPMAPHASRGLR